MMLTGILSVCIYYILRIMFGSMLFGLILFIIYVGYISYKIHKNEYKK